jgi:CHAT domain-containing protein/tetratricopeptide (TPR) repeat protein
VRHLPRHLALLVLALVACGCRVLPSASLHAGRIGSAATPAKAAAKSAPLLVPGQPVERDIGPGESQAYRLDLAAGRYVEIALEEKTSEQAAILTGPDGQALGEAGASSRQRRKVLSAVTATPGEHRLVVSAAAGVAAGRYALELVAVRPATAADPERVAARRAFAAALDLRDRQAGSPDAVRHALEEALSRFRRAGDAAGEADALNEMGAAFYDGGRLPEALGSFEQALERARAAGYTWGEAYALNNRGVVLQRQPGRTMEAGEDFRRALDLFTELSDLAQQAETGYNLGFWQYYEKADLEGAQASLARTLDLQERLGARDDQGPALNVLGLVAQARGETDEALRLFGRALDLARRTGSGSLEVSVLRNIASVHRSRGDLEQALSGYAAALASGRGGVGTRARTLHDMASLYFELGDLEKAEDAYRQAVELLPPDDADAVNPRINLGAVLEALGQRQEALARYQSALALAGGSRRLEALALHSLGRAQRGLGRPAEAVPLLERALALRRDLHASLDTARSLAELGSALRDLGRREDAAARSAEALSLARAEEDPALSAACLLGLARLDRDAGRLQEARARMVEAIGLAESARLRVTDDGLRASFFATKRSQYEIYIDLLAQLDRLHPGQGYAAEALAASERSRARGLLDLLAEGKIDVERGVDPDLKRRETELSHDLAWTEGRLAQARAAERPVDAEIERLHRRLLEVERQQELLAGEVRRRNPRYAQVRYPKPRDAASIRALLDDRTALLEYALGEQASYLFAVTREGIAIHPLPPAGELRRRVDELRRCLERPDRALVGRYVELASGLYETLLGPAAGVLAAKRELLIAPDGPLYLLPFEALLAGGPARSRGRSLPELPYLLRDHAVSYAPSASALAELHELRETRQEEPSAPAPLAFVAFADPDYGAGRQAAAPAEAPTRATETAVDPRSLPPLPGTAREVSGIAGLFPPGEVALYLHAAASKSNVKDNRLLETARRVHFATHGLLYEDSPQLSGLALAPGAEPGDDGMLRVDEIFNLKLAAQLVVLSACETALGKQVGGEGLVGMTQAFFYAGTPSLVVSLWRVSEDSTPGLMIGFYRRLEAGEDKAESLRGAKLALLAGVRYAHPFYWAPFVLTGDSRPGR